MQYSKYDKKVLVIGIAIVIGIVFVIVIVGTQTWQGKAYFTVASRQDVDLHKLLFGPAMQRSCRATLYAAFDGAAESREDGHTSKTDWLLVFFLLHLNCLKSLFFRRIVLYFFRDTHVLPMLPCAPFCLLSYLQASADGTFRYTGVLQNDIQWGCQGAPR